MTAPRSILIIANPTSGRGRGRHTAEAVQADLLSRDIETRIQYTRCRGDAERLAQDVCHSGGALPDCIVACGGDGTIQEVAHALACLANGNPNSAPALGLAPAGRCNDFARALGITCDPRLIASVLAENHTTPVDLGRANGRHFCTVATVGIDAEISRFVDEMNMPLTGTPAYLYGAIRVLMRYRPRGLRLEGDFGVIDEPVFLASTANTSSYGGAVPIAPGASPTDGRLDLCVIRFMSRLRALAMIPSVLRGRHINRPDVRFLQTARVVITAAEPLELWADGEHIATTPATIDVVPAAIRVATPSTGLPQRESSDSSRPAFIPVG
jgi:diacylglycerol kinase (ATP)